MIKAVLFDYGNTLLQYVDFSLDAYAQRMRDVMAGLVAEMTRDGLVPADFDPEPLARAVFMELMAIENRARVELFEFDLVAEIHKAVGKRVDGLDASWDKRVNAVVFGVMRPALVAREDAGSTLTALREAKLRTALVSNTQFRAANHLADLHRDGLLELLDATVFSIDLGIRKPRPEMFGVALDTIRVGEDEAVFVGDSIEHDISGARQFGMKTILIRTPDNADRDDHEADGVVDELSEIPELVAGW